jgi:DNA-binding ferritin-like protein
MKRFSEIQKKSKVLKRINEAEGDANLPSNYEDMSKEELLKLMSGQSTKTEIKEEEKEENKDDNEVEVSEGGDVVKFISKLLESREMAQVYHWTVKGDMGSHAAHLALEAYYDGVIEHIDEIVEVYQGQYGIIEGYDQIATDETRSKEKLEYFKEVAEFVKSERNCIKQEDTHLHNLIDEVVALLYRTIYKLTYNK